MKNLKKIVFGLLAMLVMVTSVSALDRSTANLLNEAELCSKDGSTINCDIKSDLTVTGQTVIGKDEDGNALNVTINIAKDVTLKLAASAVNVTGTDDSAILVKDGGQLTITGEGKVDATDVDAYYWVVKVFGNSKFTLDSTILGANKDSVAHSGSQAATVTAFENAEVNLTEKSVIESYTSGFGVSYVDGTHTDANVKATIAGKIHSTNNDAVSINGKVKNIEDTSEITIVESAKINSDISAAIYGAGYGKWTIKGGTFTGKDALSIKSGSFKIDGGKFVADGDWVSTPSARTNGSELTGSAITITSHGKDRSGKDIYAGNVELIINGGEFTSAKGKAVYVLGRISEESPIQKDDGIIINNGSFTSLQTKVVDIYSYANNRPTLNDFIKGGEFSTTNTAPININTDYYDETRVATDKDGHIYIGEQSEDVKTATFEADLKAFDGLGSAVIKGFTFKTSPINLVAGKTYNLTELMFEPLSPETEAGLAGYTITYKVSYTLDGVDYEDNYTKSYAKIATMALISRTFATDAMTMPAADIKIEVSIARTIDLPKDVSYSITVENSENGTVTVDKETAKEGETVKITVKANNGYEVSKVLVNGQETGITKNEDGTYSFVMAAADAKVSVEFTKAPINNPEAGGQDTETGKGDENNNNTGSTNENQNTTDNKTDESIDKNSPTLDSIVSIVTLAISSLGTAGYSIKKFIRK